MCFKGLWVDNEKPIPGDLPAEQWQVARSPWEALVKLELLQFEEVALTYRICRDDCVGGKEITGCDILKWIVDRKHRGEYVPPKVTIHGNDHWDDMMGALLEFAA